MKNLHRCQDVHGLYYFHHALKNDNSVKPTLFNPPKRFDDKKRYKSELIRR
ncbi:hypothetical protein J6590_090876 [Homalodisca vitripennis]|nr:hypothetical protein J6590_090876 [Homalodisca vitripennis]